eukprot:jgi/Botrbrau1/8057/Bobra.13_2s0026.1
MLKIISARARIVSRTATMHVEGCAVQKTLICRGRSPAASQGLTSVHLTEPSVWPLRGSILLPFSLHL